MPQSFFDVKDLITDARVYLMLGTSVVAAASGVLKCL